MCLESACSHLSTTAHFPTNFLTDWCSTILPATQINCGGNEVGGWQEAGGEGRGSGKNSFKAGKYFCNYRKRDGIKKFSLVMEEMQTFRYTDVSTKLGKKFMKAFGDTDWDKLSGK